MGEETISESILATSPNEPKVRRADISQIAPHERQALSAEVTEFDAGGIRNLLIAYRSMVLPGNITYFPVDIY